MQLSYDSLPVMPVFFLGKRPEEGAENLDRIQYSPT